jgi:peptidoglycan hydrolase-like protein with peptidoglycan-binding domain
MMLKNVFLTDLAPLEISELQKSLKALGYYTCPVDGKMGRNTSYAWAEWKADNHLNRHTEIGPESWQLIEQQLQQLKKKVDWTDFNQPISDYFTVGEATNFDPQRVPTNLTIQKNILLLAKELDKVREAWGSPISVNSWYRPPSVNKAVGGVRNSQHLTGKAADIRPKQGDVLAFQSWLDKRWGKALGYGAKRGFVHVDLRPGNIRWNY